MSQKALNSFRESAEVPDGHLPTIAGKHDITTLELAYHHAAGGILTHTKRFTAGTVPLVSFGT